MHTALELAADLENWLADEPVSVYQRTSLDQNFRWVKNHQHIAFAIAGAVMIALVSSLVSAIGLGTYAQTESNCEPTLKWLANKVCDRNAPGGRNVGREIHRRWELLEREALDPELLELLLKSESDPQDKAQGKLLQAWLTGVGGQNEKCDAI